VDSVSVTGMVLHDLNAVPSYSHRDPLIDSHVIDAHHAASSKFFLGK